MKSLISLFILTALTTILCAQKNVSFNLDDFANELLLKGEKVNLKQPLTNPWKIELQDSLMFLLSSNTSPAVDIFNINTGERITQFCLKGRGPAEMIYPFSLQSVKDKNEVIVQDLNGKKVICYSLDKILAGNPKNYDNIVKIDSIYPSKLAKLADGNFFCSLIGHRDGYMNCIINDKGGVIKMLNKFPDIGIKYNNSVASNLFQINLSASSDLSKVIISYSNWGWIEVFNSKGECITRFIGPDFKKPDISVKGSMGPVLTSKNVKTYGYADASEKSFMVSYSGKNRVESNYFQNIMHFGFNGELICIYKLDKVVSDIQVDWEKQIIYGLNEELEPALYKFKF
jgi:hypothetical protein